MWSWSFSLSLVFCAVSFLPAYFDHGERRKAFLSATGIKERWTAVVKWLVLNWGLPVLAVSITVAQGIESYSSTKVIEALKNKTREREISPQQKSDFIKFMSDKPSGDVTILIFGKKYETDKFAMQIRELLGAVHCNAQIRRENEAEIYYPIGTDPEDFDVCFVYYGKVGEAPDDRPGLTFYRENHRTRTAYDLDDPRALSATISKGMKLIGITNQAVMSENRCIKPGEWVIYVPNRGY